MILLTLIVMTCCHAVGLLLDMLSLLIVIRAICGWRPLPVLVEFDTAGRPLVDRTVRSVSTLWRRMSPHRPLDAKRALLVTWLAVAGIRCCLALLVNVMIQGSR